MKPIIPLLLSLLFPTGMLAQQKDIYVDTMATATPMTLAAADTVVHAQPAAELLPQKKRSLMTRFLDYFNDANKEKKNRRFDFSIIGGPHYSTDTKLGIGLVAAGLYRSNPQDTLQPPSNVSLFGDVSTVGFYMLGIRGTHIFPGDKQRIDYTTYFYSFPTDFWGMGYANGDNDDNCSDMKRWQAQMKASWLFQTADRLFIGPTLSIDYIEGRNIERPELLEGQRTKTFNLGVGVTLLYDTRDNLTAPHSGVYLSLMELARPHFLGNHYAFSTTDLRASVEGSDSRCRLPRHHQHRQSLVGHDGSPRQQLFHARLLRGTLSRQEQDRGNHRTPSARMATQRRRGVGWSRYGFPQVCRPQNEACPAQLRCGLSLGIQEERECPTRLRIRQARTERIHIQYQRGFLGLSTFK